VTDDATRAGKRGARAPEPAPRKIGRFVVDAVLGEGGMGVVLAAHDPDLDRKVAIKLLHDDGGEGSAGRGRLLREAQAMARLRHPNVVTVHEVGNHDGDVFVAMELVPGGTLRAWLERHPEASCAEILARFVPAGRGLAAAHAAGLVHRDFKPDNVMVDEHDRVLVTDFGIAGFGDAPRAAAELPPPDPALAPSQFESTMVGAVPPISASANASTLTRTGDVMGTPRYMAPEQHLAAATDARSDQFAFCAALYEALFRVKTFAGETYEVIRQHALEGTVSPPPRERDVPPAIRDAVLRGLRPEADDRWPTMDALLAALTPPAPPPARRRWIAIGSVGVATAVAIGVVAWPRDRVDPDAKRRAAEVAARACDCELVTFTLPAGATLGETKPLATGQVALPRGDHRVTYVVDGAPHTYAVRSGGFGASRTIALPAPEQRDGYVFVPGGDVPVGDLDGGGALDEQPVAVVHLAPYLIAAREEPGMVTFADARPRARAAHARLPTAAEWEWAVRLGVVSRALTDRWEWTATSYVAYPYADDGRDDAYAGGATIEVRGGQLADCGGGAQPCAGDPADAPRASRRLQAQRTGQAELRLARSASSIEPPREVAVRVVRQSTREGRIERSEDVVHPVDLRALHQFVEAWGALDDPPALQLEQTATWCPAKLALEAAGVAPTRIEVIDAAPGAERVTIRWHPVPAYTGEPARCITTSDEVEVLDQICFDGDQLRATSGPMVETVARIVREQRIGVEIHAHVAPATLDAQAVSERRAETLRARMLALGVDPARVRVFGHGAAVPLEATPIDGGVARAKQALIGGALGDPCEPGPAGVHDRVDFVVAER